MAGTVNFFNEDVTFTLKNKIKIRNWLKKTAESEGKKLYKL